MLPRVPALGQSLLRTVDFSVGKKTRISTFTEVVLKADAKKKRMDGLILAQKGSSTWRAIIEAKVNKNRHDANQISKYLESAKNDIDTFITISNEFVANPTHSVVGIKPILTRKIKLYHWSWTFIATQCEIILCQTNNLDEEQAFLLSEFLRLLEHKDSGVERYKQMPPNWKELVKQIGLKTSLKKTDSVVTDVAEGWIQETRDLTLMMTRHVGQEVKSKFSNASSSKSLVEQISGNIVGDHHLRTELTIPGAAGKITVDVDLTRKSILVSMQLKAPDDRKKTAAKVNWLLRMIAGDDPRAYVTAYWPGGANTTKEQLSDLRDDPIFGSFAVQNMAPTKFDVEFHENNTKGFTARTFIEDLERTVSEFYDFAGQHLRAYQVPPPKPVKIKNGDKEGLTPLTSHTERRSEESERPRSEDGHTGFTSKSRGWY